MTLANRRRVITGHDASGRSIIASDEILEPMGSAEIGQGAVSVAAFPDVPSNDAPFSQDFVGMPGPCGTAFTVVQFPTESHVTSLSAELRAMATASPAEQVPGIIKGNTDRHHAMHFTETVDCGVILSGEVTMLLEEGEVLLRPGDTFVQRGTSHAWANRGSEPVSMAVMMIGSPPMNGRA